MSYTMYTPLNVWLDPASVTDVVAYIQTYLSENTIYSETEIESLIYDYLVAHPELIGVQSVNGKTGAVVLSASDINTENDITIESALAALSSQISTIAANVATNITSLTGRVSTAETDISDLKSAVTYNSNPISAWEQGSISSSGASTSDGSTTRIRTIGMVFDLTQVVLNSTDYQFMALGYDKNTLAFLGSLKSSGSFGSVTWETGLTELKNMPDAFYRLCMRRTNDEALTTNAASALSLIRKQNPNELNSIRNSVPEYEAVLDFASSKFASGQAQGFCFLGTNKYVVAKTTGTDSDTTTYSVFTINTSNYISTLEAETALSTLHSNSLAFNPTNNKILCATNKKIYEMSIDSNNGLALNNTIDTNVFFSGITFLNGLYYLYGENHIWSTSDFSTFECLFKTGFDSYKSQGLSTDGIYLYHCTSGNQYNVIWVYTTEGVLVRTITLSAKYGELEEIDFYNNVMYSNVMESSGSGVYVTAIANSVMSLPNVNLSPNSVLSVNITNAVNANRWCGIFAVNGSSPDTQGAWLVMGYGAGVGRFSVTPLKAATKITVTINETAIEIANTSTVTPKLYIQWIVPPTNGVTITSA